MEKAIVVFEGDEAASVIETLVFRTRWRRRRLSAVAMETPQRLDIAEVATTTLSGSMSADRYRALPMARRTSG